MIRCRDGSFYTGIAKEPEKRFQTHQRGRGAKYTKTHPPEKIVFLQSFGSWAEALQAEIRLKRLSHFQKEKRIFSGNNLLFADNAAPGTGSGSADSPDADNGTGRTHAGLGGCTAGGEEAHAT